MSILTQNTAMTQQYSALLCAALELAARGIPVFPCLESKAPACAGGFKAASTDSATIRAMFASPAAALIGVPTGEASGLDVLDLDPRHGSDAWWTANQHRIPFTLIHETRSGGKHLVFKHRAGLRSSAGTLAPGVDVRADGGYVIHWPAAGCPVWLDEEPQPWPAWVLSGLSTRTASSEPRDVAHLAPPSAAAVVDLLNALPNPAAAGRDIYARVMLAAVGCVQALGGDPDGVIGAAAVQWAERWEGGSEYDESAKWESDWSQRDAPRAGWNTLLRVARDLIPGYVDPTAGAEFNALPVLPLSDVPAPVCELTEDAVALAFADATAGRLVYDHTAGRWYRWDGARWYADMTDWTFGQARRFARGVRANVGAAAGSAGKIAFAAAVERASRSDTRLAVTQDVWDRDPWVLGVPGGFVDLHTGAMAPADPARFISRQATVAPAAPGTPAPVWTAFLESATQGDAGLQGFLQRLAGYVLTGDITEEMLTFIHGPGQNGKGVFIGALSAIMGEYALAVPIEVFTVGARINLESHRADMAGARLVTASETEAGATWAESQIKEMTGNETKLSARRLYGHPFTYLPQFKLVIVGNHAPRLKSRTLAMERRLRIVPFTHTPAKRDDHLKEKLRAEYPAILRWAIDGCLAWQRDRLGTCRVIAEATGRYFEGQDIIGEWLAERCELGTGYTSTPADLLADFQGFARQNGAPPVSGPEFREMLDAVGGLRRTKMRGARIIQGVQLRQGGVS